MRLLCLLLPFAFAACGIADARATNLPTLSVAYLAGDSVRVVARWSRPCDGRGCADSYRVQWTAGAASRLRSTPALTDTFHLTQPAIGDSVLATVTVTTLRRTMPGTSRSASTMIRNPDAPPPPVDSLRVDTLAVRDSFPHVVVRDTAGGREGSIMVGGFLDLCALGRNRYTGAVHVLVDARIPQDAANAIERRCEKARALYATERDG